MQEITLYDFIGLLGVAGYLGSYAVLQFKREFAKSITYSFANFASALLVFVSLLYDFNLSSMIIQISWMAISSYGMYKCLTYRFTREEVPAGKREKAPPCRKPPCPTLSRPGPSRSISPLLPAKYREHPTTRPPASR